MARTKVPAMTDPSPTARRIEDAVRVRYEALSRTGSSLSCGAALDLADPRPGETVVDLGCGRGRDVVRAAGLVGSGGAAIGVDGNEAMIAAAREAAATAAPGARFVRSDLARVDLPEGVADVVVSNCAINHAPDKRAVYAEIHRLLRPGGRFVVSDVVAERELPPAVRDDPQAWAACYGGAVPESDYLSAIEAAGFPPVEILSRSEPYERGGVAIRSVTLRGRRT
jgi:arsenite methyltransferase